MAGIQRRKVTVIGAGNVGATTAQRIAESGLADVILVDSDADDAARLGVVQVGMTVRDDHPDLGNRRVRFRRTVTSTQDANLGVAPVEPL